MKVHVAIFNPQGSMGGFEWRNTREEANDFVLDYEVENPGTNDLLGVIEVEVSDEHTSNDDITSEIDSRLTDLERELGYVSPHDKEAMATWLVSYEEIVSSYRLAMESAGIDSLLIHEVEQTVEDYAVNHLGDD